MTAGPSDLSGLIDALCERLLGAEGELNALDRAIGDGDHGANLSRAARSLLAMRDELAELTPAEALRRAGKAIVMSVGGASGPLYGTLLLEMGRNLPEDPKPGEWAASYAAGVAGVARRGRSAEGEKTMLDVLAPAARAFERHLSAGPGEAAAAMRDAAQAGFDASRALRATKGRAAFVGDRSVGSDDPGGASSLLAITTLAEWLSENRA